MALQPQVLTGIAEADETMFLLSFKGKRSGLDRKARKRGGRARQTRTVARAGACAGRAGLSRRNDGLCTEGNGYDDPVCGAEAVPGEGCGALHRWQPSTGRRSTPARCRASCRYLAAGVRVDGAWPVQNVNAHHSRLKGWVCKFRGVATGYLANYPGWFRAFEHGNGPSPAQRRLALGAAD